MNAAAKTAILGTAVNYAYDDLKPFVLSLKSSGYTGDLVLFVSEIDDESLAALRADGVIIEFFETYRFMALDLSTARYVRYFEYLAARPGAYDTVVLCDTRDVLFQSDPAEICARDELCFFLESGHATLGECPWNARWLREGFGAAALDQLGARTICCSGVTAGGARRIADYISTLVRIATDCPAAAQRLKGFDQAVHNVILYKELIPDIRVEPNYGPVATLGYTRVGEAAFDGAGVLRNRDGGASAIVHQYDRHPVMRDAVFAKFGVDSARRKA